MNLEYLYCVLLPILAILVIRDWRKWQRAELERERELNLWRKERADSDGLRLCAPLARGKTMNFLAGLCCGGLLVGGVIYAVIQYALYKFWTKS